MSRRILFAEVPSFYAAVERADAPEIDDRPVIVGGDPRKGGLVQAATSEALAAGVSVDMPMLEALQLCPRARRVPTNMPRYREVSRRLFAELRRRFGALEPFGLGGGYLELGADDGATGFVADALRRVVSEDLGLPLRVGAASSKFLARLAASEAGGAGVCRVAEGSETAFLHPLPATRLEGVGRKTAARLAELGARTIGEVVGLGRERLEEAFGAHGLRIFAGASGMDEGPVRALRHPQSLSRQATLPGENIDLIVLGEHLQQLAQDLEAELRQQALTAAKVALRVRYTDRGTATPSQTLAIPVATAADIQAVALRLLERTQAGARAVRGLGIQLGKLTAAADSDRQLDLFPPNR